MLVIKSDGKQEKFSIRKLTTAVAKAYKACKKTSSREVQKNLKEEFADLDMEEIHVDEIHDRVEKFLMKTDPEVAKAYIIHRDDHTKIKEFVRGKIGFINRYKNSNNTANATVDDNSNVNGKNIGILNAEIHKEDNVQISRGMVTQKIKELYPDFNPKQYIEDIESHIIYKNDESSFAGAISPYTYSAKETIEVKYNSRHYLIPFDLLWEIIEEQEELVDEDRIVYQKRPDNLFVRERNNSFVRVSVITKKKRHRDLVRVKTSFGEDLVVTDNHPMIINQDDISDTVEAINSMDCPQFKTDDTLEFGNVEQIDASDCPEVQEYSNNYCIYYMGRSSKRYIKADWSLGYFVGFFVGDGNYNHSGNIINFTQKDKNVLVKLSEIMFDAIGDPGRIRYKNDKYNCYTLSTSNSVAWWLLSSVFKVQDKSENKTLPINLLEYSEEFSKGLICGLLDSDGTVSGSQISIRLSSRAGILQTTALLRHFGYGVGNVIQNLPFSNNSGHFNTNYTLWGINCSVRKDSTYLGDSFKIRKAYENYTECSPKYKKSGETKVISITKIRNEDSFLRLNDFIYDITTESRCFSMNNLLVHNCVSITMYPFLLGGIKGIGGLSAKPKNIDSYVGMLINLVFSISSQFAGAVALGEALCCFSWFAEKEWGSDYYQKYDGFYKIGPKLRKLLDESHYWTSNPKELSEHDFGSEELNKLRDEIVYDSQRSLTPEELEDYKNNSIDNISYTIKLGDGTRTIRGQIRQYFQQLVYSINQPAAARGMQSAFVNFSYFDKPFFDGMFGEFFFPDGTQPHWESLSWLQREFMQWFNEERTRCILTFPVESFALVYKDGKFVDEDSAKFVAEEYARGHSFFTYISDTVDSLSSCCRLKNKIQTKEFNFTNGNLGVQTGSKSVISLNLSRITQDWVRKTGCTKEDYSSLADHINSILERVYKYHTAYNELLWDMYDADLLPVYKAGFINLDKQYLTIGLNGLNQAAEFLGMDCTPNEEYAAFCRFVFGTIKESNQKANGKYFGHKITLNTECVPAESLAVKNYNWDKEDGYWVPSDTNLYASYVYKPNDQRLSVLDKLLMHGSDYIGDFLDGGSAAHINLDHHLSVEQYEKLLKYAAEVGCQYFTWNVINSECRDCGFIAKEPFEVCPKCGSTHVDNYDRIIGYLTKIKNWSEGRQIEQKTRVYSKNVEEC